VQSFKLPGSRPVYSQRGSPVLIRREPPIYSSFELDRRTKCKNAESYSSKRVTSALALSTGADAIHSDAEYSVPNWEPGVLNMDTSP
jgi:hypothetical protein